MKKEKVLVGLSGGVDSAVAAYLLQKKGYQVIAGFMKNYTEPTNPNCHTREDRNMALKVAQFLDIDTFIIFDFRQQYRERIIDYIYSEYKKGITPNPDVLCNSLIKFELFAEKAKQLGCDAIATGHYARTKKAGSQASLLTGLDQTKDQSYFLAQLSQEQINYSMFPVGEITKEEVRRIASEIGLPNANRPDSQGLCFIGDIPIKDFLEKEIKPQTGDVVDIKGNIVGKHNGAYFYTIGQRHGFTTNFKAYITNIDISQNIITVTDNKEDSRLYSNTIYTSNWHRINEKKLPHNCEVKIRYRQTDAIPAIIKDIDGKFQIETNTPIWAVTPGQFVVAYDQDEVIGSGIIDQSLLSS